LLLQSAGSFAVHEIGFCWTTIPADLGVGDGDGVGEAVGDGDAVDPGCTVPDDVCVPVAAPRPGSRDRFASDRAWSEQVLGLGIGSAKPVALPAGA
jgi:hypothetical protein